MSAVIAVVPDDWSELVARHDRAVWLSVVALGIAPDHAREIAQMAWAKLIEQRRRGAIGELRMPGLAIAQARFIALDAMRRLGIERRHLGAAAAVACEHDDVSPEAQAIARQRAERAAAALGRCSPQEQRVFHAVYDDPSRPHADIARELALSVQRVRQILCEVRRALRDAMESDS
nr:sigma-70 family RNA polymerase sigma factor [Kofleriaceae bacterium]